MRLTSLVLIMALVACNHNSDPDHDTVVQAQQTETPQVSKPADDRSGNSDDPNAWIQVTGICDTHGGIIAADGRYDHGVIWFCKDGTSWQLK